MAHLYKNVRVHQIFGANTGVGKTVITTALTHASAARGKGVRYLKPISTGPLDDADDGYVTAHICARLVTPDICKQACKEV